MNDYIRFHQFNPVSIKIIVNWISSFNEMTIKQIFIPAIVLLAIPGCIKYKDSFLQEENKHKIIALQPLDDYDTEHLGFISEELGVLFARKVVILEPIRMPSAFRLAPNVQYYSADSILNMLSGHLNKEIIEVVGITNKNIFIFTKNENKATTNLWRQNISSVFGFGDYPGNCSVVSDYLFKTTDTKLLRHRLRSVIIHEIGHNLGLDHCAFDKCPMSEENRKIPVLDNSGNDYCDRCKRILNQ